MRRRRPKLQVTTFPFLAVLLCTLGVLIMLLLILDQRSRLLARDKAEHEAAEARRVSEERRREQAARLATQLQERVRSLQSKREEVAGEAQALHARQADAVARLNAMRAEMANLERWLQEQDERTARIQQAGQVRQAEAEQMARQRTAAEGELGRLRSQIDLLERAVERLQEASRQRQPLYTLVPYRGKQGTRRPPIYLECVQDRLTFRPDGKSFSFAEVTTGSVLQDEIESRSPPATGRDRPYVLLLIRPSGINLYYAVIRALRKSSIDLGYEFVEEDWVFDFTGSTSVAEAPREASPAPTTKFTGPAAKPVTLGKPEAQEPGAAEGPGIRRAQQTTPAPSGNPGESLRQNGGGSPGVPAGMPRVSPSGIAPGAAMNAPPGLVPGSGQPSGSAMAQRPDGGTAPGMRASSPSSGRPTLLEPDPTQPREPPGAGGAGRPGGSVRSDAPPAEHRPEASEDGPVRRPKPVRGGGGFGGDGDQPRNTRPTPLGSSSAGDWTIVIECSAREVILDGPEPLVLDASRWDKEGPTLLQAVQKMVARKKSRLPEVRGQVRFRIHPDGLRTYYQAAGTLESLNLRVTWEFLAAEESRKP